MALRSRPIDSERAEHHRRSMHERRNVEVTMFGALVTAQIALIALAAAHDGKPSAHAVARFAGLVGAILFFSYAVIICAIEVRNSGDRAVYAQWEQQSDYAPESFWKQVVRSWAAWPIVPAATITALLVWTTLSLGW